MAIATQTITVNSWDWHYREAAPSPGVAPQPPVILLHGIPAHSFCWENTMAQLAAQGSRAIAPDWLGFGNSSKPSPTAFTYTPAAYLEALEGFIDQLQTTQNLGKFTLVVQGFLGSVGIQYAIAHPDRLQKLVILNAPLHPQHRLPWALKKLTFPLVGEMLTQDPILIDRTLEGGSGFVIDEQKLRVYRQPFRDSSQAGRGLFHSTKNLDLNFTLKTLYNGLKTLELPTLILWGLADPWLSGEEGAALGEINDFIQWETLPEAKHYPQEHWPEEIGDRLLPFLKKSLAENAED